MNLEIHENPNGHYMTDDQHRVLFLCKKEATCNGFCDKTPCSHTLYMERSKNYQDTRPISEEEFLKRFEKLYFTEGRYDWWEKEKPKQIWNCRTHEWEDEE